MIVSIVIGFAIALIGQYLNYRSAMAEIVKRTDVIGLTNDNSVCDISRENPVMIRNFDKKPTNYVFNEQPSIGL